MVKAIKKISDYAVSIVVLIAAILAFLLVGMRFLGFEIFTVLSGSMEPVYHTGSVIYVKDVDYTQLEVGDVITYSINGSTTATHRIVEIVKESDEYFYRTKGDANDVVDGNLVSPVDIVGSPIFSIPYLGFIATYIQNPPGTYIIITISLSLLLLSLIPSLFTKEDEQ